MRNKQKTIFVSPSLFYCRIIIGWNISPRFQPAKPPKTFTKDYIVMKMLPPLHLMEKFSYTSDSSIDCVFLRTIKCKIYS